MSVKLHTPEDDPTTHQPGDIQVWYIPQVPGKAFEVNLRPVDSDEAQELALAVVLLNTIINFSIFEFDNRIKPDYSDAAGIARWETNGDGGYGWYEVEEEELAAVIGETA